MLVNQALCQELNHLLRENHLLIEDLIEKIYSSFIIKGDICVDGGAHIGRHTIPLAKLVGESGKVFAIEPIPNNSEILLARLSKHHLSNTIFYQNALSDVDDQQCSFYEVLNLPQEGGLKKKNEYSQAPQFNEITTTTKTLDKILDEENDIHFIKLDLEGGEFNCLKGSLNTLTQKHPVIVFESGRDVTAKNYNYTKDDFFVYFEQIDYVLYDLLGQELSRDSWLDPQLFFYFFAVKRNSRGHRFLMSQLPYLLHQALNSFQTNRFIIDHDIQIYPGTSIDFTNSADTIFFHQLNSQGFSGPEPQGTWTQGSHVFLNLYSDYTDYFLLIFRIQMAFLISPHNAIDIKVFLNQKIIDIWRFEYNIFDKQIQKHVLVDPEVMKINHGRIHLELEIISPASPQILNVSSDCRELGLLISSIGCHKVNMS
jgi:FkbM family methyltransferase